MTRVSRNYQLEGINYLTTPNVLRNKTDLVPTCSRHLLRDDPGAGKTHQAEEAAQQLTPQSHSIVVIAPAHLTKQWFEDWGEQYPTDSIIWLEGSLSKKSKELKQHARVYIISTQSFRFEKYLELYTDLFIAQKVDTVIIDESHYCKNPDAATSQNIRKITRPDFVSNVILLSATPIMKEADDLFMQLRIIDPHTFSRHDLFLNEYCYFTWTSWGAQDVTLRSNAQQKLKPWIWGRTYAQIGLELPPLISYVQTHQMFKERKKAYDNIKLYWATLVSNPSYNQDGDAVLTANSAMEVMHMLRHIISSPEKQIDLGTFLETDPGPYLIACFYRASAKELQTYIHTNMPDYNPIIITGETPADDRAHLARQHNQPKDIVIATIPSISEGCDLSHCNTVYFYESDFTPGKMHQFLSRVRRHRNEGTTVDATTEAPTQALIQYRRERGLPEDVPAIHSFHVTDPNERPVIVRYFHADRSIDQHIHAVLDRRAVSVRELIKVELGV